MRENGKIKGDEKMKEIKVKIEELQERIEDTEFELEIYTSMLIRLEEEEK